MNDLKDLLGQQEILDKLLLKLKSEKNQNVLIEGPSGSGKTFMVKTVLEKWNEISEDCIYIYCQGYKEYSQMAYYTINFGLSLLKSSQYSNSKQIKKIISESAKAMPSGTGNALSSLIDMLFNSKRNRYKDLLPFLNEQEQEILYKLDYIIKDKKVIIVADNFHWWDDNSIKLINQICSGNLGNMYSFLKNINIIFVTTNNQSSSNKEAVDTFVEKYIGNENKLTLNYIDFSKYYEALNLFGLKHTIPDNLVKVLYSITGGHLLLIKQIVEYLNNNENALSSMNDINYPKQKFMEKILEDRLKSYGATGEQVSKILEIASIIGLTFNFDELEWITENKKEDLVSIISKANEVSLVETNDNEEICFSHEIIREIFSIKLNGSNINYHKAFAESLALLRPGDYIVRANHLFEARDSEMATTLYIVSYFKSIRDGVDFSPELLNRIKTLMKDNNLEEYFSKMSEAYNSYFEQKYEKASSIISHIEDIYPDMLLFEKDFLNSLSLLRSLKPEHTKEAIRSLEKWYDLFKDKEGEAWSRVASTLLVVYVDKIDNTEEGKKIEAKLNQYYTKNKKFNPSCEFGLNVLRRKSKLLHSFDLAIERIEKSISYFGFDNNSMGQLNIVQYFMALSNQAGNLVCTGKFEESFIYSEKAINLLKNYENINFPRTQMAINNYVISGVLAKKVSIDDGIKAFESLKNIKSSDILACLINLAILYALNNELLKANETLLEAKEKLENDLSKDDYYNYYININFMSVQFLLGEKKVAKKIWKELTGIYPRICENEKEYFLRRHKFIEEALASNITNPTEWNNFIICKHPYEISEAWNFFGKCFLFSDLQYWAEY